MNAADQILQLLPGKVTSVWSDLQQIASAGDVEDHVKAFLRTDAGATADMEISFAQNVAMPLPKWIICGTHGTLTNDGEKSIVRWYDPSAAAPLEVIDGPARDRKYGNDDKLPWQEKTIAVHPRPHGRRRRARPIGKGQRPQAQEGRRELICTDRSAQQGRG